MIDSAVCQWIDVNSFSFVHFYTVGDGVAGDQKVNESSEIFVYVDFREGSGNDYGYVKFEMQYID